MNTQVLRILNAREMLKKMLEVVEKVSSDFSHIKEEYERAIVILRRELGDEKIDKLIDAIDRRCEADLLFCGSLGYQSNLNNFRDPIARTFLDVDFEEYLRVHVLQVMPQRSAAEREIDDFYHSLDEVQKGVYEAVSSYLVSLELDLTKLAHYSGFMFACHMLGYTEPGYSPNLVLALRYQCFMEDWFGSRFRLWYEDEKMPGFMCENNIEDRVS